MNEEQINQLRTKFLLEPDGKCRWRYSYVIDQKKPISKCDICDHDIRYEFWIYHLDSVTRIAGKPPTRQAKLGSECIKAMEIMTSREINHAKKRLKEREACQHYYGKLTKIVNGFCQRCGTKVGG